MSDVIISSFAVTGAVSPPPSKSEAHRALIAAALAGEGTIQDLPQSADIEATRRAVSGLGVCVEDIREGVSLSRRIPSLAGEAEVDCGECGTTLRLILPVYAALGIPARFTGSGRLPQRPLSVYQELLPRHGVTLQTEPEAGAGDCLPLRLSGRLTGGEYCLPGDISSQFVSGLLLALPLCREDSVIRLTSPLESAGYVRMTLEAMRRAGVQVETEKDGWYIPGGQVYRPFRYTVEGDWSQAAFLLAAGIVGGELIVPGLNTASFQGDREILDLLRAFGADISVDRAGIHCRKAPLRGITIDASQIPDLVPVLAAVASLAQGRTYVLGAARLRLKESDRLAAMARGLNALGAEVEERPDGLIVYGKPRLTGGTASACNDHRVAMSLAVAALGCREPVTIVGADCVSKSWPLFFHDFIRMGGEGHVFQRG